MNTYLVDEKLDKFRKAPLEAVLVLCNKFKLEYDLSIALIKSAGYYLDDNTKIYKVYKILLNNVHLSLEKWDAILESEGFKPLYNKDKKCEISRKKH